MTTNHAGRRVAILAMLAAALSSAACGGSPTTPTPTPTSTASSSVTAAPPAPEPAPTPATPPVVPAPAPPAPIPTPAPAPPLDPPSASAPHPAPAASVPYYARVQSQYGTDLRAGFVVEWYSDRIEFGAVTFANPVGPSGNAPGRVLAVISDAQHQPIARLELESVDGKFWTWGYDTGSDHAVGTLERR